MASVVILANFGAAARVFWEGRLLWRRNWHRFRLYSVVASGSFRRHQMLGWRPQRSCQRASSP